MEKLLLDQDNTPAHNASSVKQFLTENQTPVLQQGSCSPRLLGLSEIKKLVEAGTRFRSVEDVRTKSAEVLKALQAEDFRTLYRPRDEYERNDTLNVNTKREERGNIKNCC